MRDTPPDVEARYLDLLLRKSPWERAQMASDMFASAKEMAIAGIKARLGELDPAELRVQLVLQFYGAELPEERRERIIASIRRRFGPGAGTSQR